MREFLQSEIVVITGMPGLEFLLGQSPWQRARLQLRTRETGYAGDIRVRRSKWSIVACSQCRSV
jgi:hypothetical protein